MRIKLSALALLVSSSLIESTDAKQMVSWQTELKMLKAAADVENFVNDPLVQKESVVVANQVSCYACKTMTDFARDMLYNKYSEYFLVHLLYGLCDIGVHFTPWPNSDICRGVIDDQFKEAIFPIFTKEILNEQNMCTFIFNVCDMEHWEKIDVNDWVDDLLSKKPKELRNNDFMNKLYKENAPEFGKPGRELLKVVILSDLHLDYSYTEGADNDCGKPLCCRTDSGKAPTKERAAGKWGDYNCDTNELVFKSLLSHIKNDIKPDVALWGGDSVPHNLQSLDKKAVA